MGYIHHWVEPTVPDDVALRLPNLTDATVSDALRLGDAYNEVRAALLVLAGVALIHHLGQGDTTSMQGAGATARACLDRARDALDRPSRSSHSGVRRRADLLCRSAKLLGEEVRELRAGRALAPDRAVLAAVQGQLVRTALPEAGIRFFTSTSCAGYHSGEGHGGHGPHADDYGVGEHGHYHVYHHDPAFATAATIPAQQPRSLEEIR